MKIIRYLGFLKYPFYNDDYYEQSLRRKLCALTLLFMCSLFCNIILLFSQLKAYDLNYEILKSHLRFARTVINLKDLEYYLTVSNRSTSGTRSITTGGSSRNLNCLIFNPIEIRLSNFEIQKELDTNSVITHSTLNILQRLIENEVQYRNYIKLKMTTSEAKLDDCTYDTSSSQLKGNITITPPPPFFNIFSFNDDNYQSFSKNVKIGGAWHPANCYATSPIAIVIPLKDRSQHLIQFLYHMHPYLQRQSLNYRIFVVEQVNNGIFNKGVLMNAAYLEIVNLGINFDCVIFHDVDLIPEDDRNFYTCPSTVKHIGVGINTFNYKLLYDDLVGGVLSFRKEYYVKVNGFTNRFWGWGGEDDDMADRLRYENIAYTRANITYARYTMLQHGNRILNTNRYKLLTQTLNEYKMDGLNSVKYELYGIVKYKLFTHILIDVGKP